MIARRKIGLLLAFCTSVGVHGVAYASLSAEHREPQASEISELNFELSPLPLPVAAPKPEPPNEVPEPQATPPALAVVRAPPVHRPADAAVAPTLTPAAPALDLSGVTLTNETGVGFAMPVGDGSGRHGPIGCRS